MSDENGFLTPTDKAFLTGEKEYTGENAKQQRYQRREAIAARARQAFHDFALLLETLDEHERNRIFDPPLEDVTDLINATVDTVAFLYHALEGDIESKQLDNSRTFDWPFGVILEDGVRIGELARRHHNDPTPVGVNIDVTFEVETWQPFGVHRDRVVEELVENGGRGLTDREFRTAIMFAVYEMLDDPPETTIKGEDTPTFDLRTLADRIEEYHQNANTDGTESADGEG